MSAKVTSCLVAFAGVFTKRHRSRREQFCLLIRSAHCKINTGISQCKTTNHIVSLRVSEGCETNNNICEECDHPPIVSTLVQVPTAHQ